MKPDPLSFFTIDHGTASTAAALIGPVGGRFRLLAASAAPRGISVEAILEDLVARVGATEPGMLPDPEEWPSWARLEVATHRPLRVVCAAGSERRADDVARAFLIAGWDVVARFGGTGTDLRAVTEACLDRSVTAVALAAGEPPSAGERTGLAALAPMIAAAAQRRPDLRVILFGGAASWSGGFPPQRVVHAPAPGPELRGSAAGAPHLARQIAAGWASDAGARQLPDGREGFIVGAASLASLLDRSVDAIDIGCAAGLRAVVRPDGAVEWLLRADAALVPSRAMTDDVEVDRILRWCALRSEQSALRDRVRNLGLAPWRDAAGDGARIRSAALRAALTRLAAGWTGGDVDAVLHGRETAARRAVLPGIASGFTRPASRDAGIASLPDLVVAAGGAFAAIPAPIAALALLDVLCRPGARTLLWDHARLLAYRHLAGGRPTPDPGRPSGRCLGAPGEHARGRRSAARPQRHPACDEPGRFIRDVDGRWVAAQRGPAAGRHGTRGDRGARAHHAGRPCAARGDGAVGRPDRVAPGCPRDAVAPA